MEQESQILIFENDNQFLKYMEFLQMMYNKNIKTDKQSEVGGGQND